MKNNTGATGPRTDRGKRVSRQNSLKHGFFADVVIPQRESVVEYESLLSKMLASCQPVGTLEEILVHKLVMLTWRYRRLALVEQKAIQEAVKHAEYQELGPEEGDFEVDEEQQFRNLLEKLKLLIPSPLVIDLMIRYETHLNRQFDRTLDQLERLQRLRLGLAVPAQVRVAVSG